MSDVVAAIDFSKHSAAVLTAAGRLASLSGATVHLVHAAADEPAFVGYDPVDGVAQFTPDDRIRQLVGEHEELSELADRLDREGVAVRPRLLMGPTVEVILQLADEVDAEWIVVASHGRSGLAHLLLGSVSEGLIRHATRPVVVVPAKAAA